MGWRCTTRDARMSLPVMVSLHLACTDCDSREKGKVPQLPQARECGDGHSLCITCHTAVAHASRCALCPSRWVLDTSKASIHQSQAVAAAVTSPSRHRPSRLALADGPRRVRTELARHRMLLGSSLGVHNSPLALGRRLRRRRTVCVLSACTCPPSHTPLRRILLPLQRHVVGD